MAYLIPEGLTRLQATAYLQDTELMQIGSSNVLRTAAQNLAEQALRKMLDDCIVVQDSSSPTFKKLHLDVFVLSDVELTRLIEEARLQGEKDALRWGKY